MTTRTETLLEMIREIKENPNITDEQGMRMLNAATLIHIANELSIIADCLQKKGEE